ncbi:MAG: HD domain-containing protein [Acidimicrobiia bacterium]|nr:HD domain-containing protein [Acidimicrobiia bacterium]
MTTATETPPQATDEAPEAAAPAAPAIPERDRPRKVVYGVSLTDSSLNRMRDCGFLDVIDDPERIEDADVVAVSTRIPPGRTVSREDFNAKPGVPIVAVCHAGGEAVAVELMRGGFSGVIAEGNEPALYSFIDPEDFTESMVETYVENEGASGAAGGNVDPVTGLRNAAAFEADLCDLLAASATPVLLMLRLRNLDTARQRTDPLTVNVLRRRLADAYEDAARRYAAETYAVDRNTFAIVDSRLVIMELRTFAENLMRVTESYAPAGVPMVLAVGAVDCGEVMDLEAVLQQAEQAVAAASHAPASAFVRGAEAAMLLASVTEMQVASRLAAQVDELLPYPDGHYSRVTTLAGRIGEELGMKGKELAGLKLAALLHDVGRAVAPDEGEDPDDVLQDAAERAGRYALTSGGEDVAKAVQHQRERWDGEGPEGIAAEEIPLFARIIAIADAIDIWMRPAPDESALGSVAVVEKLEEESGSRFDPTIAKLAAGLL